MILKKRYIIITLTSIILILSISLGLYLISENKKIPNIFVDKIIDGDTFEMNDGTIIRLLCIDTPEKGDNGYNDAKQFLGNLILNKEIRLVKPKTLNDTDKYERHLRFVYVNKSGKEVFVNKEIMNFGLGKYYPYEDHENECEILKE
jgi:endonuclease YncB( thermonuclease family)